LTQSGSLSVPVRLGNHSHRIVWPDGEEREKRTSTEAGLPGSGICYTIYSIYCINYPSATRHFLSLFTTSGTRLSPLLPSNTSLSPGWSCIRRHIRKLNRNNHNQLPTLSATRTTTILRYHNRDISPASTHYSTTVPSASLQPAQPVQAVPSLFHPSNPVPTSSVRQPKGELQSALHCPDLPAPGRWRPSPQSGPADQPPQSRLLRPSCVPCSSSIIGRVKSRVETNWKSNQSINFLSKS
jgi:hypothetical protein